MERRPVRMQRMDSDGGLWMKMDSNGVSDHAAPSAERPRDEDPALPAPPAAVPRYYSVMDDEGADDVFNPPPPPPSDVGVWAPAEGSTDGTGGNSTVTRPGEAADATEAEAEAEAEANPGGLHRRNVEKPLTAAPKPEAGEGASAVQTSRESMDRAWPSDDSSTLGNQDPTPMDATGCLTEQSHDAVGAPYRDNASGKEESNEDLSIQSGGRENWRETGTEIEHDGDETPSNQEDILDKEICCAKGEDATNSEDICGLDETDSKSSEENRSVEVSDIDDDGCESPEEVELCYRNKIQENESQVEERMAEDGEHVDSRSLDYNLAKSDWVRRESADIQKHGAEMATRGEEEDGGRKIASDIQQGEQLLQRLQMLKLRQDVQETSGGEEAAPGTEEEDLRGRDEEEREEDEEVNRMEKEKNEKNEGRDVQAQAKPPSTGCPGLEVIVNSEAGDSDEDQSDAWKPAGEKFSPVGIQETFPEVPFLSVGHRFSAAETSIEKQLQQEAQKKQNLQRAGGVFNLADDPDVPDVLEIPFKTNVSLESLPAKAGSSQRGDWQFSEQKMQKEISQEVQRELALVNQGKIPGGYSKGEVRHMKETKLLFEAFQQDNTGGPTRLRKPAASSAKGQIYPSVLERTRSLEMFSLKPVTVSRAHSLRVVKPPAGEREKSPESLRVKSPTGGLRDKTRLSPYSKQDKHVRLVRSMDSINTADARGKSKEDNVGRQSPILQQNPFFKLRPALALQPDVEKDIREAKEREEELRRQRCSLYGEKDQRREEDERSRSAQNLKSDVRQQACGKLERVWPPPSKKDQRKAEQQEPKAQRAAGQRAPLWQRWEAGLINGQPAAQKK